MNTQQITLDIRCGHCNKKLSEITPPVTLMIQRIKCPRCGEIVETYVIKPTADNHKPKEKPEHKPQEIPMIKPDEYKDYKTVTETVIIEGNKVYGSIER